MLKPIELFGIVSIGIFLLMQELVPQSYMDEIFHIKQTQTWCDGHFHDWDPKITTFPGLYLVAILYVRLLEMLSLFFLPELCTVPVLRFLNLLFGFGNYFVVSKILEHNFPEKIFETYIRMKATNLFLFPVLFFFNFLFYTDPGSTFFVLVAYYYALQKRPWLSALMAAVSVLFRQTNILWAGFICASSILEMYEASHQNKDLSSKNGLFFEINGLIRFMLSHILQLFSLVFPYLVIVVCFVLFVISNNGIVVGDKEAHQVGFNFSQFIYFWNFCLVFGELPWSIYHNIISFVRFLYRQRKSPRNVLILTFVILIGLVLMKLYSPVHLYLISDNRHYTFYIHQKLIGRFWISKYIAVLGAVFSMITFGQSLHKQKSSLWILGFFSTTFVLLTPQPLWEFRYYLVPYLLLFLHTNPEHVISPDKLSRDSSQPEKKLCSVDVRSLQGQRIYFMALNLVVFYLFFYRPFVWDHEPDSVQRFMW